MKRWVFIAILCGFFVLVLLVTYFVMVFSTRTQTTSLGLPAVTLTPTPTRSPVVVKSSPESYALSRARFVGQTFNNCGPAALSMVLSILGMDVSQKELASSMRPFNNPLGGVDDKSIFAHEFVEEAEQRGFGALHRPNGTPELIKTLIANDIPVVVRTWLNDHEDIGHFRVVTGYDSDAKTFTYQDSYYGPNQVQSEDTFNALWKPFNYGYILVYPKEKQDLVNAIVGENIDEKAAFENAKIRSENELSQNPNDAFSRFNLATAKYYLGDYKGTINEYEQAVSGLPPRMLWYQPEPIYAYQKAKQFDKAITLVDAILYNGNLAYSEMYQIKGEIYLGQGKKELAREMFEKAIQYNKNFLPAQQALQRLDNS